MWQSCELSPSTWHCLPWRWFYIKLPAMPLRCWATQCYKNVTTSPKATWKEKLHILPHGFSPSALAQHFGSVVASGSIKGLFTLCLLEGGREEKDRKSRAERDRERETSIRQTVLQLPCPFTWASTRRLWPCVGRSSHINGSNKDSSSVHVHWSGDSNWGKQTFKANNPRLLDQVTDKFI